MRGRGGCFGARRKQQLANVIAVCVSGCTLHCFVLQVLTLNYLPLSVAKNKVNYQNPGTPLVCSLLKGLIIQHIMIVYAKLICVLTTNVFCHHAIFALCSVGWMCNFFVFSLCSHTHTHIQTQFYYRFHQYF